MGQVDFFYILCWKNGTGSFVFIWQWKKGQVGLFNILQWKRDKWVSLILYSEKMGQVVLFNILQWKNRPGGFVLYFTVKKWDKWIYFILYSEKISQVCLFYILQWKKQDNWICFIFLQWRNRTKSAIQMSFFSSCLSIMMWIPFSSFLSVFSVLKVGRSCSQSKDIGWCPYHFL